jgi:hypothetical protein
MLKYPLDRRQLGADTSPVDLAVIKLQSLLLLLLVVVVVVVVVVVTIQAIILNSLTVGTSITKFRKDSSSSNTENAA